LRLPKAADNMRMMQEEVESSASHMGTLSKNTATQDPCQKTVGTVFVVTPAKGLCNQRMRIVQDIVMATLVGAAVVLPESLISRRGCHYKADCFRDYSSTYPLWSIFDESLTVQALTRAGVCVRNRVSLPQSVLSEGMQASALKRPLLPIKFPVAASQLEVTFQRSTFDRNSTWAWGNKDLCCTLFVPNTPLAQQLTTEVNAAFHVSAGLRETTANLASRVGGGILDLSIHWRDDDDFVASEHKLDKATYTRAMYAELQRIVGPRPTGRPLRALVLGDFADPPKLLALQKGVDANIGDHRLQLFTKESLLAATPSAVYSELQGFDDLKGQLDFELGVAAKSFLGSPFSSFSVAIGLTRRAQGKGDNVTRMATVDVTTGLAVILGNLFPYSDQLRQAQDPCSNILDSPSFQTKKRRAERHGAPLPIEPCPFGESARRQRGSRRRAIRKFKPGLKRSAA